MCDIFDRRDISYNLRTQTDFFRGSINTSRFGVNSLNYFASKVWNMIPIDIRNSENLDIFTKKIKNGNQ